MHRRLYGDDWGKLIFKDEWHRERVLGPRKK
jgi:hypothetical protein